METTTKTSLLLLALVAVPGTWSLRVRIGVDSNPGADDFLELPSTVSEAVAANWTLTTPASNVLPQLDTYCHRVRPNLKPMCVHFDDKDDSAGLQISRQRTVEWSSTSQVLLHLRQPESTLHTLEFSYQTRWSPLHEYLQLSVEERIALRDPNKFLQEDAIWVSSFNGELLRIPVNETDIVEDTAFTPQNCLPDMGRYYTYNFSDNLVCEADTLLPWFLLVDSGSLSGSGFVLFDQLPIPEEDNIWFESPDLVGVQAAIPNAPQCIYDLSNDLATIHIYYDDEPWNIECPSQ